MLVEANDARDALDKFVVAMEGEQLLIERLVYVSPYGDTSWQKEEDERKFANLVERARTSEKVIFDDFYAFQKDREWQEGNA